MKELYSSNAFFSYPTIVCFKPESPVSSAPCITCGGVVSLYRQKKKVLVHDLMQRAPRLVGRSRES